MQLVPGGSSKGNGSEETIDAAKGQAHCPSHWSAYNFISLWSFALGKIHKMRTHRPFNVSRVACCVSALLLLTTNAFAHAIVVKTSPAQGGVAPGNIGKVDVWYDAGIRDSLAALAVVSASGERVDKRDAAIDSADPAHVSVGVNPMTPGKYTVRYRALSADGHMVSGAWEFNVQP